MRFPTRLLPRTILAQITCLVTVAVLLGIGLTAIAIIFLFVPEEREPQSPGQAIERIAMVTQLARSSQSAHEVANLLEAARRSGVAVEQVALVDLVPLPAGSHARSLQSRAIVDRLQRLLPDVVLQDMAPRDGAKDAVAIKLNDHAALVFHPVVVIPVARFIAVSLTLALVTITVVVVFLSAYAARWITSPLSSIASAAQSFGRSHPDEPMLSAKGPREIGQVAHALNDMRTRIRGLVDDRTRMLVAISHDLRTPLTRLRLRAERVADAALRESMLRDIARLGEMLKETLIYLREGTYPEDFQAVDLPSLLQTICAEFVDVGHNVAYEGPHRFAYRCPPGALSRAATNIVENAVRHGSVVTVALRLPDRRGIAIEISDDGPGIPASLRYKVLEPFFKADGARTLSSRGGFGLGLSIARDIVRGHGGDIDLVDRAPHGLTVRLSLGVANEAPVSLAS